MASVVHQKPAQEHLVQYIPLYLMAALPESLQQALDDRFLSQAESESFRLQQVNLRTVARIMRELRPPWTVETWYTNMMLRKFNMMRKHDARDSRSETHLLRMLTRIIGSSQKHQNQIVARMHPNSPSSRYGLEPLAGRVLERSSASRPKPCSV